MFKKLITYLGVFLVISFIALAPLSSQAQIISSTSTKYASGNYDLNDMTQLFITAANWILGIVGSLTLVMFIYGGLLFLISSGSSEQISKAKGVLIAAVIGLIIVFSSYLIIKFVLSSVGIGWEGGKTIIPIVSAPSQN
ncbi:MAG: hypothetical protein PHE20_03325 [Patescibacteria group bacterium]|nr:hypothetical protein [Patescibacteria group bacterium]